MMRSNAFLVVALAAVAACGGGGDAGDVAGVFPETGFIGRTTRVEISGDTTSWDATTKVALGAGVTVSNIEVISPSSLQADLTVDPTAAPGKQDVVITDGGDTLTLAGAFELQAPFTAVADPNFEQGGFGTVNVTNLDLLHPFDLTTDAQGNLTNITVAAEAGNVAASVVAATSDSVTLSFALDVDATSTGKLTIMNNDGTSTVTTVVDPIAVAPRSPTVLTIGTAADFTVTANGALFEITAADLALLHIDMTTTDTDSAFLPGFIMLPASGKFSEALISHVNFFGAAALDNRTVAAGDKFYLIALEFAGTPGYMATFNSKSIALTGVTAVADAGDNATPATSQALTGTLAEFDGTLSDNADVDCIKIPMVKNKKMHVFTTDENGSSDSVVEIFDSALATAKSLVKSDDADFGEDVVTALQATAATRSACISMSTAAPDGVSQVPYKAFIVIE